MIMHDNNDGDDHNDNDNNNDKDDDNDNEDIPTPNEEHNMITDLIVTEALATLQQYCQQQKVKIILYHMFCSLHINLWRMQLQCTKLSLDIIRFFGFLPKKKKNKLLQSSNPE